MNSLSKDDILVRPHFDEKGKFKGYFASHPHELVGSGNDPHLSELAETPAEAVTVMLDGKWPRVGAIAVARRWLLDHSQHSVYRHDRHFGSLVAAIMEAFPDMDEDEAERIATRCEREHRLQ